MLTPVKIIAPFHIYDIGDVAGFTKERAAALIEAKVATPFVVPDKPKLADDEPKPAGKKKTAKPADNDTF